MTAIQWTDDVWNWLVGCSRISPGCNNCYAAAASKSGRLQQFERYQTVSKWDGNVQFVESQLEKPLRRKIPTKYFTCSMSDVFHENVPFAWIDKAFAVMGLCPQHTFQVLTKRPQRMLEYFNQHKTIKFPLPNVWLGVSVENQSRVYERVPILLEVPAVLRFLSCEPLLEFVNLSDYLKVPDPSGDGTGFTHPIDWLIVGGESGTRSRLCSTAWIDSVIEQCRNASVPVFVKQLGSSPINEHGRLKLRHSKGGNPNEWNDNLCIREFPA